MYTGCNYLPENISGMLQEESENMEKVVVTTVSLAYTNPDTANLDTAV